MRPCASRVFTAMNSSVIESATKRMATTIESSVRCSTSVTSWWRSGTVSTLLVCRAIIASASSIGSQPMDRWSRMRTSSVTSVRNASQSRRL